MSKRIVITFALLSCCILGGATVWLKADSPVRGQEQARSRGETRAPNPLANLNERAGAANDNSEASVRALADEVFNALALNEVPAGMLDAVKERLVRAEMNHRAGRTRGIDEVNVIRVINGLARRFNAPEYARTNRYEVRRLRMSTLPFLPRFIAEERPERGRRRRDIGSSINPAMSPLEATFLMVLMLKQKEVNPEYQVTQAERTEQWAERRRAGRSDASRQQAEPRAEARSATARQIELEQAVARGLSDTSPSELLNIPNRMLDILGVEQ